MAGVIDGDNPQNPNPGHWCWRHPGQSVRAGMEHPSSRAVPVPVADCLDTD